MYQKVQYQLYINNPRDNEHVHMYLREPQKLTLVSSFVPLLEPNQICRQEDVKMLLCKFLFFYLYFNIINLHFDLEFDKIFISVIDKKKGPKLKLPFFFFKPEFFF